ncbi:MAG: glycoside hydrolase family 3 C-terminal domain-containing protein [Oscillospiraceae bacterium]|jgi:beta-glucosidase|nr:glycoside hydrolase family 3 C-terminal domain-containing protein [Oscillospiraceae bacterium]
MKPYENPALSAQERAESIVSEMTLEEKASQLKYDAPPIQRLGLPAYNWWNEGLHGVARAGTSTMFPQAIALAAMFDTELLHEAAKVVALEARAKYNSASKHGDRDIYKGLTLWSPNVNIFRDPRWGRGHETYGECPYLTSALGTAFVKGVQGEGKYLMAAACAKHFAAHSGPEKLRHEFDTEVSKKDMEETYLPAFEALVRDARVEGVMGAYNRVNGEPACASSYLMGKLREWGFDGYFVSDCWAVRDFHTSHRVTKTAPESAAMALKSGCDCNCGNTYLHALAAYEEGLVEEEHFTKAAVNLMRTRARLGLLGEHTKMDDIPYDVVACETHRELSLKCAERSMVLLKNNGLLPLQKEKLRAVAVIGPNADSRAALYGNYFGTASRPVTFLEGIQRELEPQCRVYYSEGCHLFADRLQPLALPGDGIAEAKAAAEMSDAVILCLGLDASIEGEEGDTGNAFAAGDKLDLLLPESQRILLAEVLSVGKPTVVVLASGSSLNPLADKADALIQAWYPGETGGTALANILFGRVSPSGKLPVTFYESAEKLPSFEDYSMSGRTYRNAAGNILYPFGFGLTYSQLEIASLTYDKQCNTARVTAKNCGEFDCEDVIELYIRSEQSSWEVRNSRLCGFKRIRMKAGEELSFDIALDKNAFSVVTDSGERIVPCGVYTLSAGNSQPDEQSLRLGAAKPVSVTVEIDGNPNANIK